MELRHLRYFRALTETLNFTRASERVHVSQSTLSHQIKQLEDQLGQRLFDRVGKRVVMTESGEVFLSFVTKALKEIDQGLSALRDDPDKLSGLVRIGTTYTFGVELIPDCVAALFGRYPTARVVIEEMPADAIDAALLSESLDIGIAYRPGDPSKLCFEPLYNEEMVLAVSDRHPFAGRKRIYMVELHRQRLVLLQERFATRQMLNECFAACRAEPLVVAEMSTIASMLGLALRTTIGTIVSRNAVPATSKLRVVPIESPTPIRTPGILWKRDANRNALVRTFAALVRKTALEHSRGSRFNAGGSPVRQVGAQ